MRLYIIRHADPDYENNTITLIGHKEAKALSERLQAEKIDRIYCSSMQRSIDTMKYTQDLTGLSPIIYDWMREVEWSDTIDDYNNPWDLPGEKLLNEPIMPTDENWIDNPYFDGIRVHQDLSSREREFDDFLKELGYKREGKHYVETQENHEKIAMFCHAGFGNAIISYLLNIPLTLQWAGFWMAPTAVTSILFAKRTDNIVVPRCISYGDVSHLYKANLFPRPRGLKGDFY